MTEKTRFDNERAIEEQMRFRDLVLQIERFLKYAPKGTAPIGNRRQLKNLLLTVLLAMDASYEELKQEMHHMKRRISALERSFDSILTKDDTATIDEAHKDLHQGRTTSLAQAKKKYS